VSPPTYADLLPRLRGRGSETEEAINARLAAAKEEIQYAQEPGVHDAFVINDDLDRAYEVFRSIALGESTKGDDLPDFELPDDEVPLAKS
jgi:guanylate kinase